MDAVLIVRCGDMLANARLKAGPVQLRQGFAWVTLSLHRLHSHHDFPSIQAGGAVLVEVGSFSHISLYSG